MLTIFSVTFARPDYIQLLADALKATLRERYRFVVVVQPNGVRREWSGVDSVVDGKTPGYMAWYDLRATIDGPSVIVRDDCVPVLPWDRSVFAGAHCGRLARQTLFYHEDTYVPHSTRLPARLVLDPEDCPAAWSGGLCSAAAIAGVEEILGGVFLHLGKGTIASPDCPANAMKPRVVEEVCRTLGIQVPEPLTKAERAAHPGRVLPAMGKARTRPHPPGLGDLVAAGLSSVGITKERVQRVANAVGIKDCGCAKRQAALNRLSDRLLGRDSEPPQTA
jgi:hypothetical protein